jgi:hypothetical protein
MGVGFERGRILTAASPTVNVFNLGQSPPRLLRLPFILGQRTYATKGLMPNPLELSVITYYCHFKNNATFFDLKPDRMPEPKNQCYGNDVKNPPSGF